MWSGSKCIVEDTNMKRRLWTTLLAGLMLSTTASATMVRQEWWDDIGLSRQAIIDLLVDLANPVPAPDLEVVQAASEFTGARDNYVAKFYGWVTVPATGTYQFHYACDDYGMLYVSQDEIMDNAVEVAYVDGWCNIDEWNKYTTQHSAAMELRKGQVMAVMAFFVEDGGGDNMDIGWTGPGLSSDITNPTYLTDYITHIPPVPSRAKNPFPEIEAVDVPLDATVSWTAGKFAATHDVYLGTSFDDVNDASRDDPRGVLVSRDQADTAFNLEDVTEFGQTYYWRIDEVNAAPDYKIFKGEVWSFTAEPFAYPITGVTAQASAQQPGSPASKTCDGSGLNAFDQHSVELKQMWGTPAGLPAWIQFTFDKEYKLNQMLVWNANSELESFMGFGAKGVTVEYSTDGENWVQLENVPEFAQGTGLATYTANTTVDFGGAVAKHVRLTINTTYGYSGITGLSEVRFLYIPVQGFEPDPASGATDVGIDATLNWRAGREATSHKVYFGADANAVVDGTATTEVVTEHSYTPPTMNLDTSYYWKVDEVGDTGTYGGDLWTFTTQEFLVVDDFENYNDDIEAETTIWHAWIDGLTDHASGSTVGYENSPFAERSKVHGGKQSMPLQFDNTSFTFSEAKRTFDASQDWGAREIKTLSLFFAGDVDNGGQLYVKINNTKVAYDGDAADLKRSGWQTWNIDLSKVGNVSSVKSLTIGVEGSGAKGILYVDDIRLYPKIGEYVVPVQPEATNLVAYYTFDEGTGTRVGDSSGNGNHGTVNGNPNWVSGIYNGAMAFDGVGDYVDCGKGASLVIRDSITISCWIKVAAFARDWETIVGMGDDSYRMSRSATNGNSAHFGCNGPTGGNLDATTIVTTNTWRHITLVYDGAYKIIYIDGVEDARVASTGQIDVSAYNLYIGENAQQAGRYLEGAVDDLRIYSRPLSAEEVAGLSGQTIPRHKPF